MSAFQREVLVRFGHCDAAGWVFYPRYFEMISDFVEDWFEDGLAASAPGLFHHKQILTPSVHFTVDFVKPTRYGDRLTFNLWTVKAGNTSCELRIEASHQGELRMRVKQVLVFISAASARATPIPAIACMLMSNARRRLGDHFARTIVVNAGSIHNADWYQE